MTGTAEKPHDAADEQYGTFETTDGDTVIYDRENPEAWLQSSRAVNLGSRTAGPASSSD